MADRTLSGKAVDDRAREISRRRIEHQISAMTVTIEKYEIDILEAEQNIARTRETISATLGSIEDKRLELTQLLEA